MRVQRNYESFFLFSFFCFLENIIYIFFLNIYKIFEDVFGMEEAKN